MPTVKLKTLNRLNIGKTNDKLEVTGGTVYHKDVVTSVDRETALALLNDPRFEVRGLSQADMIEHTETVSRPRGDDLLRAIADNIELLDKDDDENFDRSGKPSVAALHRELGFHITADERDFAIEWAARPENKIVDTVSGESTPAGQNLLDSAEKKVKLRLQSTAKQAERSVAMTG